MTAEDNVERGRQVAAGVSSAKLIQEVGGLCFFRAMMGMRVLAQARHKLAGARP